MDVWDLIAERKIQEAMDEGVFDNLMGKGQPLPRDESPYEDSGMRAVHRLLRNNGFSPLWIESGKQIEQLVEKVREGLHTSWSARQSARTLSEKRIAEFRWQNALANFRQNIDDINQRIRIHNVSTPSATLHKTTLNAESEIKLIMRETQECLTLPVSDISHKARIHSSGFLSRMLRFVLQPLGIKRFSTIAGFVLLTVLSTNQVAGSTSEPSSPAPASAQQTLIVLPELPVTVAPNQPDIVPGSTVGIINALCDVTLNVVGCGFPAQRGTLTCDTNGDGVQELIITLANVTNVNANLVRVTIPALAPGLPGTGFPLACCGGPAKLTLSRTVSAGDDNVFGEFTQSVSTIIDLGERAPVLVSVSPSDGSCALGQNLLLPGACFVSAGGAPNVTSVFAVEKGNPANVVQATKFVILNANLIDAFFEFGSANAGKTFLVFAGGPNGTSRNLTQLPAGTDPDCPLGNEQGVPVTFTCRADGAPPGPSPGDTALIGSCTLERLASGGQSLVLTSNGIPKDMQIIVGGTRAKKVKFKDQSEIGLFRKVIIKGKVCRQLPGAIVLVSAEGQPEPPFMCNVTCSP